MCDNVGTVRVLQSPKAPVHADSYILKIEDDGQGMEAEILQKATNPFYSSRTTRKIGMGLPLIQMNAERTGGSFNLQSEPGKGTCMEAHFALSHPEACPGRNRRGTGIAGGGSPATEAGLCSQNHFRLILFRTEVIREIIGNFQDSNMEIRRFLKEMINRKFKRDQSRIIKI